MIVECSTSFLEWMTSLRPAYKKYAIISAINDLANSPERNEDLLQEKMQSARTQIGPSQRVELIENGDAFRVCIFTKFVRTRRYKLITSLQNNQFRRWDFTPDNNDLGDILDFIDHRIRTGTEQEIIDAMELITPAMISACIADKAGISEHEARHAIGSLHGDNNTDVINLLRILRLS